MQSTNAMKVKGFGKRYKSFAKAVIGWEKNDNKQSEKPKDPSIIQKPKRHKKVISGNVMSLIDGMNKQLKSLIQVITNICSSDDDLVHSEKKARILEKINSTEYKK